MNNRHIAGLLRTVEADRNQVSGRRDDILRDALAQYDRAKEDGRPEPILLHENEPETAGPGGAHRFWLAAAALIVIVGMAISLTGRTDNGGVGTLPSPTSTTSAPSTSSDDGLDPSRDRVSIGSVSFEVPDGLEVVHQERDVVVLQRTGAGEGPGIDSIVLLDIGTTSFDERITALDEQGLTLGQKSTTNVDEQQRLRWEISPTNAATMDLGCVSGERCVELIQGVPESSLTTGVRTVVVEITTPEGRSVLVISPAMVEATELLQTLSVR